MLGKIVVFLAASAVGAIGWWIGAYVGFMTAFFLSVIGTGVGTYVARRWVAENLF